MTRTITLEFADWLHSNYNKLGEHYTPKGTGGTIYSIEFLLRAYEYYTGKLRKITVHENFNAAEYASSLLYEDLKTIAEEDKEVIQERWTHLLYTLEDFKAALVENGQE